MTWFGIHDLHSSLFTSESLQADSDCSADWLQTYQSVPMEASTSSLSDDSQMDDGAILQSLPSVHDAVPFANRHLSDMGIPVEDFGSFSWRVNNYRTQPKRMTSPEFEVGGHKWNILLFPQGNSNGNSHGEAMVSDVCLPGDCSQGTALSHPFSGHACVVYVHSAESKLSRRHCHPLGLCVPQLCGRQTRQRRLARLRSVLFGHQQPWGPNLLHPVSCVHRLLVLWD